MTAELSIGELNRFLSNGYGEWKLDAILYHNQKTFLFYRGGDAGQFILISPNGKFEIGRYDHAKHGITDGCFYPQFGRSFASTDEAIARLREVAPSFPYDALIEETKRILGLFADQQNSLENSSEKDRQQ